MVKDGIDDNSKVIKDGNTIKNQTQHRSEILLRIAQKKQEKESELETVSNKESQPESHNKINSKTPEAQKSRRFRRRLTPILHQTPNKNNKSSSNDQDANDGHPYTGIYTQQLLRKHQSRQVYRRRVLGGLRDTIPQLKKQCNCKRSHCLKLYCECFASGIHCSMESCNCVNCYNNDEHSNLNVVGVANNHQEDETKVVANDEVELESKKTNIPHDDLESGEKATTTAPTLSIREGGGEKQAKKKRKRLHQKQNYHENGKNIVRNGNSTGSRSSRTPSDRNEAIYTTLERNPFAFRPRMIHENTSSASSSSSSSVLPLSSSASSYHYYRISTSEQYLHHAKRKYIPHANEASQHFHPSVKGRDDNYTITEKDVSRLFQGQKQEQQQQQQAKEQHFNNDPSSTSLLSSRSVGKNDRSTFDVLNLTKINNCGIDISENNAKSATFPSSFAASSMNIAHRQLSAVSCIKNSNQLMASGSLSSSSPSVFASASSSCSKNEESRQKTTSTADAVVVAAAAAAAAAARYSYGEQKGQRQYHNNDRFAPSQNTLTLPVKQCSMNQKVSKRNKILVETDLEKRWRIATESAHDLFDSIQLGFILNQQQQRSERKEGMGGTAGIDGTAIGDGKTYGIECSIEGIFDEKETDIIGDNGKNTTSETTKVPSDRNNDKHKPSSPPSLLHQKSKTIVNNVTKSMQKLIKATHVAQLKVEKEWEKVGDPEKEKEEEKSTRRKQSSKKRKRRERTDGEYEDIERENDDSSLQISQPIIDDNNDDVEKAEHLEEEEEGELLDYPFAPPSSLLSSSSSSNKQDSNNQDREQHSLTCTEILSPSKYYCNDNDASGATSTEQQKASKRTQKTKEQHTISKHAQKELNILVAQDAALLHELARIIKKQALKLASKRMHGGG